MDRFSSSSLAPKTVSSKDLLSSSVLMPPQPPLCVCSAPARTCRSLFTVVISPLCQFTPSRTGSTTSRLATSSQPSSLSLSPRPKVPSPPSSAPPGRKSSKTPVRMSLSSTTHLGAVTASLLPPFGRSSEMPLLRTLIWLSPNSMLPLTRLLA